MKMNVSGFRKGFTGMVTALLLIIAVLNVKADEGKIRPFKTLF